MVILPEIQTKIEHDEVDISFGEFGDFGNAIVRITGHEHAGEVLDRTKRSTRWRDPIAFFPPQAQVVDIFQQIAIFGFGWRKRDMILTL